MGTADAPDRARHTHAALQQTLLCRQECLLHPKITLTAIITPHRGERGMLLGRHAQSTNRKVCMQLTHDSLTCEACAANSQHCALAASQHTITGASKQSVQSLSRVHNSSPKTLSHKLSPRHCQLLPVARKPAARKPKAGQGAEECVSSAHTPAWATASPNTPQLAACSCLTPVASPAAAVVASARPPLSAVALQSSDAAALTTGAPSAAGAPFCPAAPLTAAAAAT